VSVPPADNHNAANSEIRLTLHNRKIHIKTRPLTFYRSKSDVSAHAFHKLTRDRQSQARAAFLSRIGCICLGGFLENPAMKFRWNARPVVCHSDAYRAIALLHGNFHDAVIR
jgi:hypothetical protein